MFTNLTHLFLIELNKKMMNNFMHKPFSKVQIFIHFYVYKYNKKRPPNYGERDKYHIQTCVLILKHLFP
ncbi:hypothetical protein D3C74_186460 [compost metagenome]